MEDENLVTQFQAITNETTERSRFYLEAVNWDLNAALGSFYDNSTEAAEIEEPMPDAHASVSNEAQQQQAERDEPMTHDKKV